MAYWLFKSEPDVFGWDHQVALGDKGGEFNKIYLDTFARIVLRGEAAKTVLEEEGEALAALMTATGAPCWQPDQPSDGACPVD